MEPLVFFIGLFLRDFRQAKQRFFSFVQQSSLIDNMRTNVFIVVALCLLGNYSSIGSDLLIFNTPDFTCVL
jgi:hypothetical protein